LRWVATYAELAGDLDRAAYLSVSGGLRLLPAIMRPSGSTDGSFSGNLNLTSSDRLAYLTSAWMRSASDAEALSEVTREH
jgi:hypothetical protein